MLVCTLTFAIPLLAGNNWLLLYLRMHAFDDEVLYLCNELECYVVGSVLFSKTLMGMCLFSFLDF